MPFEYIGEGSSDYSDKSVIAIIVRDDIKITFIKVDDELIEKDFDCLSWFDTEMLIGVSESYVDEVLDESIAEDLSEIAISMGDRFNMSMLESLSVQALTPYLQQILAIVMATSNPDESSVDIALSKIVDQN